MNLFLPFNLRNMLYKTRECSDVTVILNGKEFLAHKCILYHSEVLKAMIDESKNAKIFINDSKITAETFEVFLEFLYLGFIDSSITDETYKTLIYCSIKFEHSILLKHCLMSIFRHSDPKISSLSALLKNCSELQNTCDITFIVHGKEIKAHKFFLSFHSSVFKVMFDSRLVRADGKHVISDPYITAEIFEYFLLLLYYSNFDVPETCVKELLHLGHMYDIYAVMKKCVAMIMKVINKTNILEYATLGYYYFDSCSLLQYCIEKNSEFSWITPETALLISKDCPDLVKILSYNYKI